MNNFAWRKIFSVLTLVLVSSSSYAIAATKYNKSKLMHFPSDTFGSEDVLSDTEFSKESSSVQEGISRHFIAHVKNNVATASSKKNSISGDSESGSTIENPVLTFSHTRNYCHQKFNLTISANQSAEIFFTSDCSTPTRENGTKYTEPILIDSTTIIKAIAFSGSENSDVVTHSYFFTSTIQNQPKNPAGFPETWGGAKTIPADYEMDPDVINDSAYSHLITDAFESIPTLSLTMETDEWFNHETGLYVGYPNSNETREKPVTAEFIFNNDVEESFAVECGVQNQGGTSIVKWKSPKQSMRLLFKEIYGPTRLRYKLFPDSEINSINTLVVDNMLNATWIHPWDDKQRLHAMYLRDQLTSDLSNKMGRLSFHGRYFHLFLNGLYWGICDLHERPDDAFLSEYLDAEREDFDIIKHNPERIVSGSNQLYLVMLQRARMGFSTYQEIEDFKRFIDIPAFIDYMLLNFYLGNFDWAHQNFYAGRDRTKSSGFRFYPWDSEHVMRFADVYYDNTGKNNEGGPTEIHTLLKENDEYRMMFADAVFKHLFNDGELTPVNFMKSFLKRKNEIEDAVILESARWGDYRKDVSGITYTKNEYWMQEVNRIVEEYIPLRRDIVIEQFRKNKNNLFPDFMPPQIEDTIKNNGSWEIALIPPEAVSGDIYFTLDGSDPRAIGGGIKGTKYSDEIIINNTTKVKTRFYSVSDKSWSALAEKLYLFDDVYGENLVINEIMYHPKDDYPEFIEIMNFGTGPVNLNGFRLTGGINYLFETGGSIEPGAGIVLTNDVALFRNTYKFSAFGQYQKRLSNSGETIILRNEFNQLVDSVSYSDTIPWPVEADGDGYSLELINGDLDNSLASSWRKSEKNFGSPYNMNTLADIEASIYPNPFQNEITINLQSISLSQETFQVEVFNQTGSKLKTVSVDSYNSRIHIPMKNLNAGIYFLRLIPDSEKHFKPQVFKVIKIR